MAACTACTAPGSTVTCTPCNRPFANCVCVAFPGEAIYANMMTHAASIKVHPSANFLLFTQLAKTRLGL